MVLLPQKPPPCTSQHVTLCHTLCRQQLLRGGTGMKILVHGFNGAVAQMLSKPTSHANRGCFLKICKWQMAAAGTNGIQASSCASRQETHVAACVLQQAFSKHRDVLWSPGSRWGSLLVKHHAGQIVGHGAEVAPTYKASLCPSFNAVQKSFTHLNNQITPPCCPTAILGRCQAAAAVAAL